MKKNLRKIFTGREFILLVFIIAASLVFSIKSDVFLKPENIRGLIYNISFLTIIGTGMTILFISGGFDMSAGANSAFLGIILGILLLKGVPVYLAVLLILILGIINGIIIGIVITKLGVNAFITTLGFLFIFRGASIAIASSSEFGKGHSGLSVRNFSPEFLKIAGGEFLGVQYLNYYMLVILIIMAILLYRNVFFRQNYFVGGNSDSAKLAGIRTNIIIIFNFALVSFLIAVASILKVSRLNSASATAGGQETGLAIIAAVIIGGASLRGGSGSIIGTFFGVILISVMNNGLVILGINPFYTQIFVGGILLFFVILDELVRMIKVNPVKKSIKEFS